ncbi:MAG: FMN-binding negative transcriptional regulator [Pseudomonadota bacterium]
MYNSDPFAETRLEVLHGLIAAHPLGTLVTQGPDGLCADHVPFEIGAPTAAAPFGVLRAHVARANPLWRTQRHSEQSLVVFQGPQAYITPAWYEEKALSGKVVPTYNYAVVHAHGALTVVDDPAWLLALLERLTTRHEAGRPVPWKVGDAPPAHLERLLTAIIGIEMPVNRIEGKWKVSQNRSPTDQATIATGLAADGTQASAAMAAMMSALTA